MLKKIFSYGAVEGYAKGLNKLTLLILPIFLNTIDYGKIGLLVAIELVVPLISLLGFERAILRFYSDENKYINFKSTIFKSVKMVHIFLLVLISLSYLFGFKSFYGLNIFPDIYLIIILIYFQGSNLLHLNMIRVSQNHNKYFKARILIQTLRVILIFLFVYLLKSYLGYLIGSIITAILSNFFFKDEKKEINTKFNKNTFSLLFTFSWPFIFHGVAGSLLGNVDKFILQQYMTLSDVGLYTLAYSIGSMMVFAYVGITIYLEPMIYKEKNDLKRNLLLDKFLFYALISGMLFYLIISIMSNYVLPHIYENKFHQVIEYIPMIAVSYLIFPYYLKSNYLMIFEKKSLNIALISVISSLVNIALNLYYIPKYGIIAAVYTTLISYIIQSILFVLMANKFILNKELLEVIILGTFLCSVLFFKDSGIYICVEISIFLSYIYFSKIKQRI